MATFTSLNGYEVEDTRAREDLNTSVVQINARIDTEVSGINGEIDTLNSNLTNYVIIQQTNENVKYLANQRTMINPTKPVVEGYEAYLLNARHVSTMDIALTGISNNVATFFNSYDSEYTFDTWFDWILIRKLN